MDLGTSDATGGNEAGVLGWGAQGKLRPAREGSPLRASVEKGICTAEKEGTNIPSLSKAGAKMVQGEGSLFGERCEAETPADTAGKRLRGWDPGHLVTGAGASSQRAPQRLWVLCLRPAPSVPGQM